MQHPIMGRGLVRLCRPVFTIAVACLAGVAACRDASEPVGPIGSFADPNQSEGRGIGLRLYAIGTSVSAGTCSDGNTQSCQENSWVAQIIRAMHREPSLPLIAFPGCKSPLKAPLITFQRESGEPVTTPEASLSCAPNVTGFGPPSQVMAVPGALTIEALTQTPAARTDPYGALLYRRLLPLEQSQITALEDTNPKFVTVELGLNEMMGGVTGGRIVPGVSVFPFANWVAVYDQLLDRVGATTRQALLVGLRLDVSKLQAFRYGSELWNDRAAFVGVFNVQVDANCEDNTNLVFVPINVVGAVGAGLQRLMAGLGPAPLSCAAGADSDLDRILTTSEVAAANAQFVLMDNHVIAQATLRGYAYLDLEVLFDIPKAPFSVVTLMTTLTPYGAYVSLDGVHPFAAGHTLMAQAALEAIDARYNYGFDNVAARVSPRSATRR